MENNIQMGMIMDGVSKPESETKAKETLDQAVGVNQEKIMEAMARYKAAHTTKVRKYDKVGRNDPCPCGSGKKYKNCCMNSGTYEGLKDKKK